MLQSTAAENKSVSQRKRTFPKSPLQITKILKTISNLSKYFENTSFGFPYMFFKKSTASRE